MGVVLVGAALLWAALVTGLGLAGNRYAAGLGAIGCGIGALGAGTSVYLFGRRGLWAAPFRRWLGAALCVWGAGQVAHGLLGLTWPRLYLPTAGDLVAVVAVSLAMVGCIAIPRAFPGPHPGLRLAMDALLLGVAITLLVWLFAFRSALAGLAMGPSFTVAALVLLADVTVTALAFLAGVRDLDRDLLQVFAGAVLFATGDLVGLHESLRTGGVLWPWQTTVLWCLAGPPMVFGLMRYRPEAARSQDRLGMPVDPDARVTSVTTITSLVLLTAILITATRRGMHLGTVGVGLLLLAVGVFAARELLNARLRSTLLNRIHDEALTDPLTGLANRRMLTSRLAAVPQGEPWCLLTVDLDGFKEVNALLGHAAGDRLLETVGGCLQEVSPPEALVCRIGGDEFAVLMPGDLLAGERLGERIVAGVHRCAAEVHGANRLLISASVGVAAVGSAPLPPPPDREQPEIDPLAAVSASGAALRMAKAAGRDRVEVFDEAAARLRQRRLTVEERLRAAVARGDLTVDFQPIVDLRRQAVSGVEALARWHDAELGTVGPCEFIPVAEQTGLVVALGELILHRTLADAVAAGLVHRGLRINVNVSPVQLRVPGFHRVVEEALTVHRMPAERLVLEVTEAVLVDQEGPAVATLGRLAREGVTIAIDDFGTGYSAIGYLGWLPAQMLKIDRSLTASLGHEPRIAAITRAVVELGRTIGLSVVAEGIDSLALADLVTAMGVGYGQGSYFGQAQPALELARLIQESGSVARPA